MRKSIFAALVMIAAAPAGLALAQGMDTSMLVHEGIGMPMKPSDAGGGYWLLQTKGRTICELRLSDRQAAPGVYGAHIPAACAEALPPGLVGWRPVTDGLALVDADAHPIVDFNQWTPRNLTAKRAGASALELIRPQS